MFSVWRQNTRKVTAVTGEGGVKMVVAGGAARKLLSRSQVRPAISGAGGLLGTGTSSRQKSIAPPLSVRGEIEDRLSSPVTNRRKDQLDLCFEVKCFV